MHPWLKFGRPLDYPVRVNRGWDDQRTPYHQALDLRARVGDPVYAVGDGVVEIAKPNDSTAGNWVGIRHEGGLLTRYLHLSAINVAQGQRVAKGDLIGLAGSTGKSSGPHLHFDAVLPEALLPEYVRVFGRPTSGFFRPGPRFKYGFKVPSEPMIPIDEILRPQVVDEARASGLRFYAEIDRGPVVRPGTRVAAAIGLVALVALGLVIVRSEWA